MTLFGELNKRMKGKHSCATWYTKLPTLEKIWIKELCDLLDKKTKKDFLKEEINDRRKNTL